MTTMLIPAIRSWANATRLWREHVAVMAMLAPESWKPATWAAMRRIYTALTIEGDELVLALDDVILSGHRSAKALSNLRDFIAYVNAEVPTFPRDVIPEVAWRLPAGEGSPPLPGLKGLGTPSAPHDPRYAVIKPGALEFPPIPINVTVGTAAPSPPQAAALANTPGKWDDMIRWIKWVTVGCYAILGFTAAVSGTWILYRTFLRSPGDRIREEGEGIRATLDERRQAMDTCGTDTACRASVSKYYEDLLEGEKCGILDTPIGSILGLLGGSGFGYVGMRKIIGLA